MTLTALPCQAGAAPKALDLAAMMLKKAGNVGVAAGDLEVYPLPPRQVFCFKDPPSLYINIFHFYLGGDDCIFGWGVDPNCHIVDVCFSFFLFF